MDLAKNTVNCIEMKLGSDDLIFCRCCGMMKERATVYQLYFD